MHTHERASQRHVSERTACAHTISPPRQQRSRKEGARPKAKSASPPPKAKSRSRGGPKPRGRRPTARGLVAARGPASISPRLLLDHRQWSGKRSRSVFLIDVEQKGHPRPSWIKARVHGAQVMLCPHGCSVTCAGASMQTTQPSSGGGPSSPCLDGAACASTPRRPPPRGAPSRVALAALPAPPGTPPPAEAAADVGACAAAATPLVGPAWRQKRC